MCRIFVILKLFRNNCDLGFHRSKSNGTSDLSRQIERIDFPREQGQIFLVQTR